MSRTANPYVDWLGIPDSVSRPNYYELLGIPQFEDDENKIKGGYYRRVAQVSVHQTDSNADACQLLLVELAEARDCLTDGESCATYAGRIGEKHGVPPRKLKEPRNQGGNPTPQKPPVSPRDSLAPSVGSSAASEAGRQLKSVKPFSPMLQRRVASDAQLARLRSQPTRSPFGMFAMMKSPAEIIAGLASTRGLTPLQARLAEDSPDELVVGSFVLEQELKSAYRLLETPEASTSKLWQHVDEFTLSNDNSRLTSAASTSVAQSFPVRRLRA